MMPSLAAKQPDRPPGIGTIDPVTLFERDDDLAALNDQWQRARRGHGSMVVVTGEPGAGKTSLVQAFVDRSLDGSPVLWGACDPLSTPRPLGPLHDVADRLDDSARAALRDAGQPHEIFAAVFEHLRARPSVFVVDDLHWADQGTVDLLRFQLRRIGSTRSLIIVALREQELAVAHPVRSLLGDVARSPDAVAMAMRPLTVAAVASMVDGRTVDPGRIVQLTGGNPFFVTEMLDHHGDDLPVSVRDAILARTADLTDESWDVLHLLSCAPEAIADHLLADLRIGIAPLRAVDQAGLIRRGSRGVAFRHDLCRLAIATTIPPGGEVTLHRRMLAALEASPGADPAVLTHHSVAAGDRERVGRYAPSAARAAARSGAHRQAATFYRLALHQGDTLDASAEATLLEAMAEECYLTDQLGHAVSACERAKLLREQAGDAGGVSFNHHSLSVYQWYSANRAAAEQHASHAVTVLGARDAGPRQENLVHLGHAFAMQAYLALQASEITRARELLTRARDIADRMGDRPLGTRVALIAGACDVTVGNDDGRRSMLSILATASDDFDEIYSSGYSNLTYLDVEQRRLRDASELLAVSMPLTVERDLPICRVWQLGSRGRLELLEGSWAEAFTDADAVLESPSAPLARTWPFLVRGLVALRRSGSGRADLDAAWELAQRYGEPIRVLPAAAALAEQAWLTGQPDERLEACRALLTTEPRPGLDWARGDLALWLRRLDPQLTVPSADSLAEPYRIQLSGQWRAAADTWAALSAPYEQALALVESDDPDDVREALDALDRLGADAVADRLRLDLRNRGVASVPARRRGSTLTNPCGLTARELDVLGLLAEGLTNAELAQRLYISAKTADHHVSAILSKMGVANRRQAAARGRELDLVD